MFYYLRFMDLERALYIWIVLISSLLNFSWFSNFWSLRRLTALEQRQHSKLATARSTAENISCFNQPKFSFLPGTLHFSIFYLKDLAKIFLLTKFDNILNTQS